MEKEKILPITKKRVRLSMDEKLWIINHRKENPKIKQNKIALDFSAKLKKTVSRTCILSVLQKSDQILAFSKADPELERKKDKKYKNNYKSWGHKTYF